MRDVFARFAESARHWAFRELRHCRLTLEGLRKSSYPDLETEEAKKLEKDIKEALDFIRDWAEEQTLETVKKYASSYRGLVGTIAKRWPAIQGLMAVAKMGISAVEIQDITEKQREAYYTSLESMIKMEYIRHERIEPLIHRLKECEEDLKERGN